VPIDLRARAADLEAMRGNMEAAFEQMKAVVTDDPDYFWAWSRLADWYDMTQQYPGYREAAEHMVRISPRHAPSWGYLADAMLRFDRREDAKTHFKRAVAMAPDYVFGVVALFGLCLEDGELDDAADIFEVSKPHLEEDLRLALDVRLTARRGDYSRASKVLWRLCGCPLKDDSALSMAVGEMLDLDQKKLVKQTLTRQVNRKSPDPWVAVAWVDMHARLNSLGDCPTVMEQWDNRSDGWELANQRLLKQMANSWQLGLFNEYVRTNRTTLMLHDTAWGAVAETMLHFGQYDHVISWQNGWKSRHQCQQWMLFPMVVALWDKHLVSEAVEVGRAALGMEPDRTFDYHRLWMAIAAIFEGDIQAAENLLEGLSTAGFPDYYVDMFRLVSETVRILVDSQNVDGRVGYATAKRQLLVVFNGLADTTTNDKLARWIYHRLRWRIAKQYKRPISAVMCLLAGSVQWG